MGIMSYLREEWEEFSQFLLVWRYLPLLRGEVIKSGSSYL
jgi:hypothetical protein